MISPQTNAAVPGVNTIGQSRGPTVSGHTGIARRGRELWLMAGGLLIVLTCSAVDAVLQVRTSDPAYLAEAARRIADIPAVIGDWESVDGHIDDRERRLADIVGSLRREYRHRFTGYRVTVTVLSGKAGPMTVHPPTACFQGVGYALRSNPVVTTIKDSAGNSSELNRAVFARSEAAFTEIVRVFWGWGSDGHWQAPANPRVTLRGQPGLYKLYVVDRTARESDDLRQAELFMEDAMPLIRQALNPSQHTHPNTTQPHGTAAAAGASALDDEQSVSTSFRCSRDSGDDDDDVLQLDGSTSVC